MKRRPDLDLRNLQIVYEDNHLIAVNKRSGWLVHDDITKDPTLVDLVKQYIKMRYKKPGDVFLGVVHRLDQPVSGTIIFARTSKALSRMNELIRNREIKKVYYAVVNERPDPLEGKLQHYLLKNNDKNTTKAYEKMSNRSKGAKLSTLAYSLKSSIANHHMLEVIPETGRSHQIRVQLASMGCSIRGDVKYGSTERNKDRRIHLHSKSLEFIHPVKKEKILIESSLPAGDQIWRTFRGFD